MATAVTKQKLMEAISALPEIPVAYDNIYALMDDGKVFKLGITEECPDYVGEFDPEENKLTIADPIVTPAPINQPYSGEPSFSESKCPENLEFFNTFIDHMSPVEGMMREDIHNAVDNVIDSIIAYTNVAAAGAVVDGYKVLCRKCK